MDEVRADRRVEVGQAAGNPAHALVRVDRAREGERRPIEAVQTELGAKHAERCERDPAVGRELAARHAQHPALATKVDGLPAGARGRAVPGGEDAQPGERGSHRLPPEQVGSDRDGRLGQDLLDIGLGCLDILGLAVVERVGRAEQEHALPGQSEREAHLVVRDGERRRPRLVEAE